jgi:hypothetical protein
MDKIIGITNAPDDAIVAVLRGTPISVLAHGKYVGGHIVIYEDSQQIASGDLVDGQDVGGTGTYAYSLTPTEGYSGYDDAKSYRLVIDGDEINLVNNGALTNIPFDAMYIIADFGRGMQVEQTYPNLSSVSVSQAKTVTTKKYQAKKLDKSLLPDGVESGIESANTKAATALSAAQAAQNTANEAISGANTAQTTANTAQSTANTAKSTAETALARAVEPYTGITQMAPLYKNGGFSAWRSVVQILLYDKTEGYFSADGRSTTALNGEDMPNGVFYALVYVGNRSAKAFLTKVVNTAGSGSWSVSGFAVIDDGNSRTGEILYVSSNMITQYAAKGLFLTFRAPDSMLLKSSTSGSDKQFRITVDDTGTLKATEVTDA